LFDQVKEILYTPSLVTVASAFLIYAVELVVRFVTGGNALNTVHAVGVGHAKFLN